MVGVFDRLDTLTLTANGLECECDLIWFKNWLLNSRYSPPIVNGAECYRPQELQREQVAYAQFCVEDARCYTCDNVLSNEECTTISQCGQTQTGCQNTIRINDGIKRITKGCKQLEACLSNNQNNLDSCNEDTDGTCWYCCQGDLCNGPETAVVDEKPFSSRQVSLECPTDWALHGYYCYYISGDKFTYADAQTNCQGMGAMLASIHSQEEQDFILEMQLTVNERLWIGLDDRRSEGDFRWIDDTPVDFDYWATNQPDAGNDDEDCVHLIENTNNMRTWHDKRCIRRYRSVCKILAAELNSCQEHHTPNKYEYQYIWPKIPADITYVTFRLRAKNDGHISLSAQRMNLTDMYEIVLGGWDNGRSVIRLCKQCDPVARVDNMPDIVSEDAFRDFYISFQDGLIQVGLLELPPFMSYQHSARWMVNYIGISTGFGSTGTWVFCGYAPVTTATTTESSTSPTPTRSIAPKDCYAEVTDEGDRGLIEWPTISYDEEIIVDCPYQTSIGETKTASRQCTYIDDGDTGARWEPANVDDCPTDSEILKELADEEITEDNIDDVSEMLLVVTSNPSALDDNDVTNAVVTIEHMSASLDTLQPTTSRDILTNVLETVNHMVDVPIVELDQSQVSESTSTRILKTIDEFALGVHLSTPSIIENTQGVDMAVVTIDNTIMGSDVLFRSVGTARGNHQPEVFLNLSTTGFEITDEAGILQASVLLPNSLLQTVADDIERCQFVMYQDTTFFQIIDDIQGPNNITGQGSSECSQPASSDTLSPTNCNDEGSSDNNQDGDDEDAIVTILNSVVISASIGDIDINGLQEPAVITLRNINQDAFNPRCVYWDESLRGNTGGWSKEGCQVNNEQTTNTLTVCECDHLTNFAMIMDVYKNGNPISKGNAIALSVISYIGCAVSFVALSFVILTYTMCGRDKKRGKKKDSRSGRREKRTKILLNLVGSLMLVNFFFICGSLVADFDGPASLCIAMAIILHYSLFAAMLWMALEAFDMYMALVKVFESYYSHYLLKMCIVGWGLPVVPIAFVAGFDINHYGYHSGVCWLSTIPFYTAFLAPVCLILTFNSVVFILVSRQLYQLRQRKLSKTDSFDVAAQLRASFSITFLLGLTWILAIFAVGEADLIFSYLFAIVNSLQGFSLFFFQCVLNPDIRRRWYRICCPRWAPPEEDAYPSDATTRRITAHQKISTSTSPPVSTRVSQFESPAYNNASTSPPVSSRVSQFESPAYNNASAPSYSYANSSTTENTYDTGDPDYEAIAPLPPTRTTRT